MGEVQPGHLVQLHPKTVRNLKLAYCVMVVEDVYSWGVHGYIKTPEGRVYYRAEHDEYEIVGFTKWL